MPVGCSRRIGDNARGVFAPKWRQDVTDCGISVPADHAARPVFALPQPDEFARLGLHYIRELHGGHQSRVVLASSQDASLPSELVVKLIDSSTADHSHALERLQVRDRVATYDDRVVPIVMVDGAKVHRIGNCLAVASPKIDGRFFDVGDRPDVERMGRALARLHQSLRLVHSELPVVSALRAGPLVEGLQNNHQLLHGDFSASNLLLDNDGRTWIFDFDDCGFGPVEFELGNTLFMALFSTSPSLNQPSDAYQTFRKWFLGSYQASAEHTISELLVNLALQTRSDALRYWLNHLDEAPIGIRNASEPWRDHLRSFAGVLNL